MNPLDHPLADHELVTLKRDPKSGLLAIVAIHNRTLGPAIGGCRILPYPSIDASLTDVLRLSRGMTYKCAIGGIPYGGGKAVIIADPTKDKTTDLLHAFGDFVDSLGGRYITSFDSGSTLDDIRVIGERTPHVGGITEGYGNASESTALGVFHCMREGWSAQGGELAGARVAIQGMGNVGARLARLLAEAGATLTIADTDASRLQGFDAQMVASDRIHAADVDIFAPCALGAVLNTETIPNIKARLICGGANNQLAEAADAERLQALGIAYCPDYLANAGGIIELHHQRSGGSPDALADHLHSLGDTMRDVLVRAERERKTSDAVAAEMAEARFRRAA